MTTQTTPLRHGLSKQQIDVWVHEDLREIMQGHHYPFEEFWAITRNAIDWIASISMEQWNSSCHEYAHAMCMIDHAVRDLNECAKSRGIPREHMLSNPSDMRVSVQNARRRLAAVAS